MLAEGYSRWPCVCLAELFQPRAVAQRTGEVLETNTMPGACPGPENPLVLGTCGPLG